ncbi:alpha-1B-glycoprotein-like [Rhineura floridana]|uniref:alpha-1B-glycoprotein-like n=1 Tax=Rhineura floridana TaxID=261503 RepID=UPI002AC8829E|nr:alpha-1B-glycoprotein-like [Rhineura floridana]
MPVTLPFLLLTISLPKPSIFWLQAPDVHGKHRLQCTAQEEYAGSWFYLYQGPSREPMAEKKALPTQSKVTFAVHSFGPSEQFHCSYEIWEAGKSLHSPLSSPANITEDHYPKPSITVSPSTEVLAGQDWTIRCWAPSPGVNFVLYQAREFRIEVTPRGDSNTAEFSLKNVTMADAGQYTCYYHSTSEPFIWSNASDPVHLRVIDATKVPSYQEVLVDSAGRYRVNCSVPSTAEGWFYLYQGGQLFAETRAWHDGTTASFNLTEDALNINKGELSCQYRENRLNDTEVWTQDSRCQGTDYTTANSLRLGIGACILLLALLFIAEACWDEKHQKN